MSVLPRQFGSWTALIVAVVLGSHVVVQAEVTPAHREALLEIKSDLTDVARHLRQKELDQAETLLESAEERLKKIIEEAQVSERDRRLLRVPQLIATHRRSLERQRGRSPGAADNQGVSFSGEVAPILVENCLDCHGTDNPRAGLSMATFAGIRRGGRSGRVLTPRSARNSRIIARLTTTDANRRMPRGGDPLSREQINTIATWINQGARYDADSDTMPLNRLDRPRPNVVIPKPKGTETVSFTKAIAPFMVRLCLRCHSGGNPRGGLSLVTFEDLMIGGDSGEVIIPGNRTESRLFRLVGGLENPRMPQGQARITRQNYEDLIKWFDEGNVFDGEDPRAPLTSLVPTDEDREAARFAAMSTEEFLEHRRRVTEDLWKRSLPSDAHETLETEQLLLVGNVTEQRLQQVAEWADEHITKLQRMFDVEADRLWKGKLAIVVFKDRFGFSEYVRTFRDQQASPGMFGDSRVTATHSAAYVVLQDLGDGPTADSPGLKANLIDHLSGAFVQRGGTLPDWIVRGTGLALAAQEAPSNPYFKGMLKSAASAASAVARPDDLFRDGTFSPADIGPVGYALVEFLLAESSSQRFAQLIGRLHEGAEVGAALQSVYRTDANRLGQTFLARLRRAVAR